MVQGWAKQAWNSIEQNMGRRCPICRRDYNEQVDLVSFRSSVLAPVGCSGREQIGCSINFAFMRVMSGASRAINVIDVTPDDLMCARK